VLQPSLYPVHAEVERLLHRHTERCLRRTRMSSRLGRNTMVVNGHTKRSH
jgi:hypothetical protein